MLKFPFLYNGLRKRTSFDGMKKKFDREKTGNFKLFDQSTHCSSSTRATHNKEEEEENTLLCHPAVIVSGVRLPLAGDPVWCHGSIF